MQCFVHKETPCHDYVERETVEHISMKLFIAHELHALQPLIDHPVGNTLVDIYLPHHNVAIECQSSLNLGKEIRDIIKFYEGVGMAVTFVWGSRAFARIKDTGSRFEHYKIRATAEEETVLSLFPEPEGEGSIRELVNESIEATYEARPYVYYRDRKLWWLHIFKKLTDRIYLGTKHPFLTGNLSITKHDTDIGTIAMFRKRR